MLSERQQDILRILKSREDYITIHDIAQRLSFSPKTIRNDLNQIRIYISQNNLGMIQTKPKKGVRFLTSAEEWDKLQNLWSQSGSALPCERRKYQICKILLQQESANMAELEKGLYLGRSGVEKALDEAKEWLGKRKIQLCPKHGKGYQAVCSEFSRRLAYLELYQIQGMAESSSGKMLEKPDTFRLISSYFPGFNAIGVVGSLNETEQKYGFHFEYSSRHRLFF